MSISHVGEGWPLCSDVHRVRTCLYLHSTSLCSPTRAALITGRNHHVAGFGVVAEYYVPGATHAPHHPTAEWVRKISDMSL